MTVQFPAQHLKWAMLGNEEAHLPITKTDLAKSLRLY